MACWLVVCEVVGYVWLLGRRCGEFRVRADLCGGFCADLCGGMASGLLGSSGVFGFWWVFLVFLVFASFCGVGII